MSSAKDYDVFVSYTHRDSRLVHDLALALKRRRVRVWLDEWEIQPGESLRRRVVDAISTASYILVIISPDSLQSNWVQYELDSAMIDDIESSQARVIPALAGDVKSAMLPPDLRSKYCLDLRTREATERSIGKLVDLIRPEERSRKELLERLRKPLSGGDPSVSELKEFALNGYDQRVQIAALVGLGTLPGHEPTLAIVERALDGWGCGAIERAISQLGKRERDGGVFALSATLFSDSRYIDAKLDRLTDYCLDNDDTPTADNLLLVKSEWASDHKCISKCQELMLASNLNDIRMGAPLCTYVVFMPPVYERPPIEPSPHMIAASSYSATRLPGLVELLRREQNNTWPPHMR